MQIDREHSGEIIRYKIPQEKQNGFEEAYTNASAYLEASPFCLGYNIIHGKEEPNHYIVIIYWTSMEDHLSGFRKSADFIPFFNLVKPFFNDIEEMKHYEPTTIRGKEKAIFKALKKVQMNKIIKKLNIFHHGLILVQ
jgi:quinol monooxygenase YgiN